MNVPSMGNLVQATARDVTFVNHILMLHCHCVPGPCGASGVYSYTGYKNTTDHATHNGPSAHVRGTFKNPLNNESLPRSRQIMLSLMFFITLWEDLRFQRTRRGSGSDRLTLDHVTWGRHRTTYGMGRLVETCDNRASWIRAAETATNDLTMTCWRVT